MSTVNYLYPVAGSPPSTHASNTSNLVVAQLVMTDLDTTATITHYFQSNQIVPPNAVSDLASGFPLPMLYVTSAPTTTVGSTVSMTVGTNTITVAKSAQVGSAFTAIVSIARPGSQAR